jgi:homoserine trans-succinylase
VAHNTTPNKNVVPHHVGLFKKAERASHHPNVSGGTDAPSARAQEIHSLSFIILKRVPKTMRNENNIMSLLLMLSGLPIQLRFL